MKNKSSFEQNLLVINKISKELNFNSFEKGILSFVMPTLDKVKEYANHSKDAELENVNQFGLYTDLPFNDEQQYINFLRHVGGSVGDEETDKILKGGIYSGLGLLQRNLYYLCVKINSQL